MSAASSISAELPEGLHTRVQEELHRAEHATPSELVRAALRHYLDLLDDKRLRRAQLTAALNTED